MGKVVPFIPLPPAYPRTANCLDPAERMLLLAIRWWVIAFRRGADPFARVWENLSLSGAAAAAPAVDALMATVARTVQQPIVVHCPCCPTLSAEEKQLIYAANLVQAGERRLAQRALHTTLLSAQGAEFAIGPLERLGELFAGFCLFFGRRALPLEYTMSAPPDDI